MIINDDFNNYIEYNTEKVNLILTDIPYAIGTNAYASNVQWWKDGDYKNGKSEKANQKFFETDENFSIDNFLNFCKNNLEKNSTVVTFCSIEQLSEIIQKYKNYGFKKYIPLIFTKNNSAEVLKSNMRIVGACEYGIQLFNGKLGTFNNNKKMIKNWFNMRILNNKKHPNEKPLELLEEFIKLFTNENDIVLDCCMGSGTTIEACIKTNRRYIGYELDKNYYEITKNRIEMLTND